MKVKYKSPQNKENFIYPTKGERWVEEKNVASYKQGNWIPSLPPERERLIFEKSQLGKKNHVVLERRGRLEKKRARERVPSTLLSPVPVTQHF